MCGIAGIVRRDGTAVRREVIESMCRRMIHRGPDDEGVYLDRHAGLGHRRLSIIDRAAGHQPLCNEDGTVWIAFNGEIYNFREIREELLAQGHTFRTHSDTEVIVHLYEDLAEGCVQRLQGMFAFAIWDSRRQTLLLARDRLGIKPLYYADTPRFLAFSSEIKSLLAVEGVDWALDPQALHDYLTLRYNVAPQTMWHGISKLPPGHVLILRDGRMDVRQYWDLDFSKKVTISEEEAVEEFRRRLQSITRSHLVGEVPLGVLLSGGLDSTVITGLVAEEAVGRVKTFSVGFEGEEGHEQDELGYARMAARYFNTDHHELRITSQQYADGLRTYLWHMEEPMADPSAVPLYYIAEQAAQHVTILLSGEGSDELLAGYSFWEPFKSFRRAQLFGTIPSAIRNGLIRPLNRHLLGWPLLDRYLELAERPASHYPIVRPINMTNYFSEDVKFQIYRAGRNGFSPSMNVVSDAYRKTVGFDFLDQMLYVYTKQWLPDDLLLKADKMTMAHSLELRVPFLDHTLVEFAASLPTHLKMRRNGDGTYMTKYVMRKAVAGRIPDEILNRKKVGFHVPVWNLYDTELRTLTWDLLRSRAFRESGLFDVERIEQLIKAQHEDWGLLWPLLAFATWYDLFGGPQPAGSQTSA